MSTSFNSHLAYFYLVSPLHTGGSSQEGNLVGIARESHTDLPYLPSSTIRGRLRASTNTAKVSEYWGNTIEDVSAGLDDNLTQGSFWIGDAAILWFPVPSLSHGTVWISSPALLKRWARWVGVSHQIPAINSFSNPAIATFIYAMLFLPAIALRIGKIANILCQKVAIALASWIPFWCCLSSLALY
jgi:CRISPR/Cas system CMR subunit Cmr4 (Cas7 group RAMP superfamily)